MGYFVRVLPVIFTLLIHTQILRQREQSSQPQCAKKNENGFLDRSWLQYPVSEHVGTFHETIGLQSKGKRMET
jgi:hypothetical protein